MEWLGWDKIAGDKKGNADRGRAIQLAINRLKSEKGLDWILKSTAEEVKAEFFLMS